MPLNRREWQKENTKKKVHYERMAGIQQKKKKLVPLSFLSSACELLDSTFFSFRTVISSFCPNQSNTPPKMSHQALHYV